MRNPGSQPPVITAFLSARWKSCVKSRLQPVIDAMSAGPADRLLALTLADAARIMYTEPDPSNENENRSYIEGVCDRLPREGLEAADRERLVTLLVVNTQACYDGTQQRMDRVHEFA
jgi:hypothetical protein